MLIIKNGGVSSPLGFKANGIWSGIKKSGKPDLALIVSDNLATAAGVFTKNSIKAAPLIISQKNISNHKAQAIVVNSGNANCFTGSIGLKHAQQTTAIFAKLLKISTKNVIVTSTGIIGKQLPFNKIKNAAPQLIKGLSKNGSILAAKAILTTDLAIKQIAVEIRLSGQKVILGACAKGSGMIAPNMATMLGFITTDAAISPKMLTLALKQACDESFNAITIDGCMSTNDMVVVLANGQAQNKTISHQGKDFQVFLKALKHICLFLSKKIVLDGEGATKFITVNVSGAKTPKQAKNIALTIANSVLVKTAAFGSNPNWGRVAAAVGSLGLKDITEKKLKITFSPFDKKEIAIYVNVGQGKHAAKVFTCDLSYDYVKINAEYN
ncbi:MAG TPA: bifunctional glutamate N-acetyltransferase/amino-acid acetyltransferase ArgJ [Candidatus Omnitrophota bacterium]|nr:bifunctional glutamate N-acetyltransferase/amino-acid acetyltransferase ArgJ [Candidatus Omnitrophota bacterium]